MILSNKLLRIAQNCRGRSRRVSFHIQYIRGLHYRHLHFNSLKSFLLFINVPTKTA